MAPPCVAVYMTANSIPTRKDDLVRPSTRISYFFAEDIQYKRISDILATKGYMKEKPALKKAYLESHGNVCQSPAENEQPVLGNR